MWQGSFHWDSFMTEQLPLTERIFVNAWLPPKIPPFLPDLKIEILFFHKLTAELGRTMIKGKNYKTKKRKIYFRNSFASIRTPTWNFLLNPFRKSTM